MEVTNTGALSHIQGWGADLDKKNRPAVPKERIPARDIGVHWDHPEKQPITMEVLQSNERPHMTPLYGTSVAPKGVSGILRRIAFKFSENDIRHWLILFGADRINVVEGIAEDISKGHIPNIFAEMGIKAELKYNKEGFIKKVMIGSFVLGAAYMLFKTRKPRQLNEAY